MGLFTCRGCESKDAEIQHLMASVEHFQALLERQQKQLLEFVKPGSTYRMERPQPRPVESVGDARRRGKPRFSMPGYEPDPVGHEVEIE